MNKSITENEQNRIFANRNRERFELLQTTKKTVFEFCVDVEEKGRFLQMVSMLSNVEFMVDVDIDHIWIRKISDDQLNFRIKVSGKEKDVNRWNDNLCCVAKFLRDEYDITHLRNIHKGQEV